MKVLFTLDNYPYKGELYLTSSQARELYLNGKVTNSKYFNGTYHQVSKYKTKGYYEEKMTFEQFLQHHRIKIL